MTIKAGVWIDHHKAVVVLLKDKDESVQQILAEPTASKKSGARQGTHSYTPNDFVAEDNLERKATSHLNKYYDEVITCLQDADGILVLGPGEAKGELTARIKDKKLKAHLSPTETVDKMTDREIATFVRQHFQ